MNNSLHSAYPLKTLPRAPHISSQPASQTQPIWTYIEDDSNFLFRMFIKISRSLLESIKEQVQEPCSSNSGKMRTYLFSPNFVSHNLMILALLTLKSSTFYALCLYAFCHQLNEQAYTIQLNKLLQLFVVVRLSSEIENLYKRVQPKKDREEHKARETLIARIGEAIANRWPTAKVCCSSGSIFYHFEQLILWGSERTL